MQLTPMLRCRLSGARTSSQLLGTGEIWLRNAVRPVQSYRSTVLSTLINPQKVTSAPFCWHRSIVCERWHSCHTMSQLMTMPHIAALQTVLQHVVAFINACLLPMLSAVTVPARSDSHYTTQRIFSLHALCRSQTRVYKRTRRPEVLLDKAVVPRSNRRRFGDLQTQCSHIAWQEPCHLDGQGQPMAML